MSLIPFIQLFCLHTFRIYIGLFIVGALFALPLNGAESERTARQVFAEMILAGDSETEVALLEELGHYGDPVIVEIYDAWRTGGIYTLNEDKATRLIMRTDSGEWQQLMSGENAGLSEAQVNALEKERASRGQRKTMQTIIDTLGLKAADAAARIDAAMKMGMSQNPDFIPALEARLGVETDSKVQRALREALAISMLKNADSARKRGAVKELHALKSIPARGFIEDVLEMEIAENRADGELAVAAEQALVKIENSIKTIEFWGSFFRGFSLGSVLLIVSFGLAITFGLMGIINMAHGEFIAIGGYTTYLVQNLFINLWGIESTAFGWYFVLSLPVSFVVAGIIGLLLERSVIRFLYRRPLESLLCTWGISMIMQQCLRLIFGAANVQVNTPGWLLGNYTLGGFQMSLTRLFIMVIALVVVVLTWLLLRKTNLGLHIRAVMQNRNMASSLGIPVNRVNAMTFALGCGLAALGGAVLSQIGNVGPSMGQAYLVDSFMVVVIGSIGNLLGAGISAMGIGMVDQLLQPSLGPVMGKITVFFIIILFLQWRPGGLFPSRSRSLED